jgi:hypothetical protein
MSAEPAPIHLLGTDTKVLGILLAGWAENSVAPTGTKEKVETSVVVRELGVEIFQCVFLHGATL